MANDGKFLTEQDGNLKRETAIQVSAGAPDADKIARVNADGQWDETLIPNAEVQVKTAFETLAAGDFIYVRPDGQLAKADATTAGKEASGFVRQAIVAASTGKVYGEGILGGFVGLTQNSIQWLSTTAGGRTEIVPSTSGNIQQPLGRAWSDTEIKIEFGRTIELD